METLSVNKFILVLFPCDHCQNGGQCLSNETHCTCTLEFTGLFCESAVFLLTNLTISTTFTTLTTLTLLTTLTALTESALTTVMKSTSSPTLTTVQSYTVSGNNHVLAIAISISRIAISKSL